MIGAFEDWRSTASTGDTAPPAAPAALAPAPSDAVTIAPSPTPELAPATAPPSTGNPGLAVVLVGAGAAAGWAAGGAWGAGAGALFVGAARNGLRSRAQWPTDPSGAAKSATLAVIGAALGGYLAYRAYRSKTGLAALE